MKKKMVSLFVCLVIVLFATGISRAATIDYIVDLGVQLGGETGDYEYSYDHIISDYLEIPFANLNSASLTIWARDVTPQIDGEGDDFVYAEDTTQLGTLNPEAAHWDGDNYIIDDAYSTTIFDLGTVINELASGLEIGNPLKITVSGTEFRSLTLLRSTLTFDYGDGEEPNSAPVPEPATLMLLGSGLVALAGFRKKQR